MIVISTRDFRANQTKYMKMANDGEDIILKSRSTGTFRLVPVKEKEEKKRDITDELVAALRQVRDHMDGKIELQTADSLIDELRNNTL